MNNNLSYLDFLTILGVAIGIIALVIGLENLEENRHQNEGQEDLLKYLEKHLQNQDDLFNGLNEHLKNQDELLKNN